MVRCLRMHHHWTIDDYIFASVLSLLSVFLYGIVGVIVVEGTRTELGWFQRGSLTKDAHNLVKFLGGLFWPPVVLYLAGRGIKKLVPWIGQCVVSVGRGARDLYRMAMPAKVKVPKAQARERRSA